MHVVRKRWSRRDFIRAAGIVGGAAALGPWIPSPSHAASGGLKRLLLIQTGNGSVLERWRSNGAGAAFKDGAVLPELQGPILAPLERHRDKLLLLDGIDLASVFVDGKATKNKGHAGSSVLWTGLNGGGQSFDGDAGQYPNGPSLDQVVNDRIGEGRKALRLAIWNRPVDPRQVYSYDLKGTPLPVEPNPQVVFDDIFRDGFPSSDGDGSVSRIGPRRLRSIDILRSQLKRLRGQMPATDVERFDQHVAGLDALEQRIKNIAAAPGCTTGPDDKPSVGKNFREAPGETIDAQIDNLVHAFSCDLARVASFSLLPENSWTTGSLLKQWVPELAGCGGIHTASHEQNQGTSDAERKAASGYMTALNRWSSDKIAALVDKLIAAGLMDDTLIVWSTSMSHGGYHDNHNVPVVVVAGSAGPLATDRYLRWGSFEQDALGNCNGCEGKNTGESNNNLLISLCHAMGLSDVTTFGKASHCRASGLDDRLMK
jgi:hypothetical protein